MEIQIPNLGYYIFILVAIIVAFLIIKKVTTCLVKSIVDDLRYDDETSPYDAASSFSGRASSHNIASTSRPNVQRRQSDARRSREAVADLQSGCAGH